MQGQLLLIADKDAYIIAAAITPAIAAIGYNITFRAVAATDPLDSHPVKLAIPLDISLQYLL
jgi:hypothetical protein